MINLTLSCFKDKPEKDGETYNVALDLRSVSNIVEFQFETEDGYGTKVTLSTGEAFLCSDEFMHIMRDINETERHYALEERMFQYWQHSMSIITSRCIGSEYNEKETKKDIANASKVVALIAKEWIDFRNEVM